MGYPACADPLGDMRERWIRRRMGAWTRTRQDDLSDADLEHMRKVTGYVARHLAQRPDGDVTETAWRYSLMNWGHDPVK